MGRSAAVRGALAALAAAVCAPAPARAHIVYSGPTLQQLVTTAEVVARARIAGPASLAVGAAGERRAVIEAELLDVWKGGLAKGRVRFAQHGHGVAPFEAGDEAIVFLQPIARSAELRAVAGSVDWVSLQEHDDEWQLAPDSRAAVADAVQGYVALAGVADPERSLAGRRQLTLELLTGAEPRLAASALQDLVRAGDVPLVRAEDLPALAPLLEDARAPIGLRAGVLAELQRRGLVRGEAAWLKLIDGARPADRPAALRAAGAHAGPQVIARLVQALDGDDAASAEAAAVALGIPGNAAGVQPLARALQQGDARLRGAAIRGLGRIGVPEARSVLERAANTHADADTRRRAAAELRVLAGET
jgi:hypothetical protein